MKIARGLTNISVIEPDNSVVRISNAEILNNKIYIPASLIKKIGAISMYEAWGEVENINHFDLKSNSVDDPFQSGISRSNGQCLMVFDTWGTTSYYHLLIDHIIPLWITRSYLQIQQNILISIDDIIYYRISKNNYMEELMGAQEIFKYFMGNCFLEEVSGVFEEIILGYFYSYRPYHGPYKSNEKYINYGSMLNLFREKFSQLSHGGENIILVPTRKDRVSNFVGYFTEKYQDHFNFVHVDFAALSVHQQIKICGSASGIFGSEGAALANQIFLPNNSVVIAVTPNRPESLLFHQPLAEYCGHFFWSICEDIGSQIEHEIKVLEWLNLHLNRQ